MVQVVNKNTFSTTYKDDYADSDGYYRILFNSGRKLQARELTQMQTILQKQIERMGNNIFQDNSVIKAAATQVDNNFQFIRLNTTNEPVSDPQSLVGAQYTGISSNVIFRVDKVVAQGTNAVTDPLTLYGTYVSTENSSADAGSQITATANEVMTASGLPNVRVENSSAATGFGSRFLCDEGIYYSKGFFIFTDKQELIISKYTNSPSTVVGFKRIDEVVTTADDTALFDNQGSTPNITAPGADRYRIRLELVEEKNINSNDTFIRKAVIQQGVITSTAPIGGEFNKPRDFVATRIKENSGDYLVKPFTLKFLEDSANTHLLAQISDGVAVVDGYRASLFTTNALERLNKARSTITFEDQLVPVSFGNYFEIDSVPAQVPDLTTANGYSTLTIMDGADFGGNPIGTCFVRFIEENNSGGYNMYVTNVSLNSGSAVNNIHSIGTDAQNYFNVNQNSRDNGPFNNTNTLNSLLFPLPNNRPADISNADLTVQRQFRFTPAGSSQNISTANDDEAFVNTGDWLVTKSDGSIGGATITLSNGNKTATIGGLTGAAETAVTAFVRKSNVTARTKTVTYMNEVRVVETDGGTSQKFINLHKADIIDVSHVEDPNDSSQSYKNSFRVDTGHRDNFYDNGKLFLTSALPPNAETTGLRVRYSYYAHSSENTFFDKTSYDGQVTNYSDIPKHTFVDGTRISLSDYLDFRPTVDSDGEFEVANGGSTNELPTPTDVIDLNVDYYLPRADKICIDTNGIIRYLEGTPSFIPVAPETPKGTIELFRIRLNPNTFGPNDLDVRQIDRKRYTMDQINLLEKRLGRLEEAVSLSLLETKTDSIVLVDSIGDIRLKSGFVVDNFKNHALSDVTNPSYRGSLDLSSGLLYPRKVEQSLNLEYDSDVNNPAGSTVMKIQGGFIIPKFDTEVYMENEFASNSFLVNPFQVNSYFGSISLSPSSDTWYESEFPYDRQVNYQGSKIVPDGSYKWGDWEWNWLGKDLEELQAGDITNKEVSTSGRTTTTSWNVVENIYMQENYVEDRLIRTESIPKMRAKLVRFKATGLRPNAKHYAFFDDVSVDTWCRTETFTDDWQSRFNGDSDFGVEFMTATTHPQGSQQLTSNDFGEITGSFFIPASDAQTFRTGTLKFELKDVTGVGNENFLSRCVGNFTSEGTLKLYQEVWNSTRYIEIEGDKSVYTKPVVNTGGGGGGGDDGNDGPGVTYSNNVCYADPGFDINDVLDDFDDGWGGGWSNSGGDWD